MSKIILLLSFFILIGCTSNRSFWRYVVGADVDKPLPRETGTPDVPRMLSPHNVKVVYNDGSKTTEVLVPILASGQQIVIDHQGRPSGAGVSLVPLPPTDADKSVEDAYTSSGKQIQPKAPPVSIVQTHKIIRDLVKEGNYAVALEYCEQLLKRYPNHVKTLRTKGSILLKLGEREAALKAYQQAQDIEPDPKVEEQIKAIEKALSGEGGVQ